MKILPILAALLLVSGCSHSQTAPADAKTPAAAPAAAKDSAKKAPVIPSTAQEEVQLVEGVACNHGKDARRLEVHTKEAGCSLKYMKFGKSTDIATANHGVQLCQEKLKVVRKTLETAGYHCE